MRISRNILNNMMMENQRRNPLYQTIITDLAITGNIDREDAEMLLGYEIPAFLHTPDGQSFEDESEDPVVKDDEDEDDEDEDEDEDDEDVPLVEAVDEADSEDEDSDNE